MPFLGKEQKMRKRLALAASVCLVMSSGTLLAQQQPDQQTPVQQQEQQNADSREAGVAAVTNSANMANELRDMNNVSADSIRVVQLYDSEELNNAIDTHKAEIDSLRNALEENEELWSAVRDAYMKSLGTSNDDAQLLPSQVVAIERSGDDLTVYIGGETSG